MKTRKTMEVASLKDSVNRMLKDGIYETPEYRMGAASVLEHVLHATGNYKGFRYTDPTAERTSEGYLVPNTYDESRRTYY